MLDRFVAFDVEMPGQREMRISAIGITVVENGEVTDRIYHLVNPETEFEPYVVKLIGITPEMVEDKPTFPEVWEKIKDVMSSGLLVAHGATGDMKALCSCLKAYNIEWKERVEYLCTCDLGRLCYPDADGYSLDVLCENIGFPLDHHYAMSDSEGCARILLDYMDKGMDVLNHVYVFDTVNGQKVRLDKQKKTRKKKTLDIKIRNQLFACRNSALKKSLINRFPQIEKEKMIGVTEADIKKIASRLLQKNSAADYVQLLPHEYLEENNIHAFLISSKKKFSVCVKLIEEFLPYVDNDQTCSLIRPKVFKSRQPELVELICKWLSSERLYTRLFAVNTVLNFYQDEEQLPLFAQMICDMKEDEQVINKKRAVFFERLLILNEKQALQFFCENRLDKYTHNTALKKAMNGNEVSEEKKQMLLDLMI